MTAEPFISELALRTRFSGPNKYYGYYGNLSRGKRKKQDKDDAIPSILEPEGSSKEFRKNWARLIQKIYEVDPLTCPKCSGAMKVISVIENKANLPILSYQKSKFLSPKFRYLSACLLLFPKFWKHHNGQVNIPYHDIFKWVS